MTTIPEQHPDTPPAGPADYPEGVPADPVVPPGTDPIDGLMVAELAIASRQLGCDVYDAVADTRNGAGRRWDALPLLAWLWAKRTDPRAKLEPFTRLRTAELNHLLRFDEQADAEQLPAAEDPTAPAPG